MKIITAIIFLNLFFIIEASAITRHVYSSQGAAGLQSAISATQAGDTVLAHSGTYYLADLGANGLVIMAAVTLRGADGEENVIFSGESSDGVTHSRVVTVVSTPATATLEALTIRDGNSGNGGGLLSYYAQLELNQCRFDENEADTSGGGLLAINSDIEITNCSFKYNKSESGAGISIVSSVARIDSVSSETNEGVSGGGLLFSETVMNMTRSRFFANRATNGAGILIDQSSGAISFCEVLENQATNSGGIMIVKSDSLTIADSYIDDNDAAEGGGFYLDSCGTALLIARNSICRNTGIGYGSAIYMSYSLCEISENIIDENICRGDGAVFMFESSPRITGNQLALNQSHGYGGALYVYGHSQPEISYNSIYNNQVDYGAALYIEYESYPVLQYNTIVNNIARIGGVITCVERSKGRIENCMIVDNGSTENISSGYIFIVSNADSVSTRNCNLYYNTFQTDEEVYNGMGIQIDMSNNFWWETDSAAVRNLIVGHADITPVAPVFITGTPGEPMRVDSIHTEPVELLVPGETIELTFFGQDRSAQYREAAVAIITSNANQEGIAVALVETEKNSGIYQGSFKIEHTTANDTTRLDDIRQILRVLPPDTIAITANVNRNLIITIPFDYNTSAQENQTALSACHPILGFNTPNPFKDRTAIPIYLPEGMRVEIYLYNLMGEKIQCLYKGFLSGGSHEISVNGEGLSGGIYFYSMQTPLGRFVKRMLLLK